jgi:uncharacterized repeat protein (TIGR02543 family)
LYAVWEDGNTAVSVTASGIEWTSQGVNKTYNLVISSNGTEILNRSGSFTTYAYNFANQEAGDYQISVTVNGKTTTVYYKNKALARVSLFDVEGNVLTFHGVENAEKYLLTYECGTAGHQHTQVDLGSQTAYDFSDCDMREGGIQFTVEAVADGYATSQSAAYTVERNLDAVTGLQVDAATDNLSWNAVQNADGYVVAITRGENTTTVRVSDATSLSLENYYGDLQISVYPVTHGYNSPAQTTITYAKNRLLTPTNIRFENNAIVWDEVEGAEKYVVKVGNNTYELTTASIPLTEEYFVSGQTQFDFTVQAVASNAAYNSLEKQITLKRAAMNDTLTYANGIVAWDSVIGATKFGVKINDGEEQFVESNLTSFDVKFTQEGENTIYVRCYEDDYASEWVSITVQVAAITYDYNYGDNTTVVYLAKNDAVVLPELTRTGYGFIGWYTAKEAGSKIEDNLTFNGEQTTYYAQWSSEGYTVTLDVGSNGKLTGATTYTVYYGSTFALPVPQSISSTKAFVGWYSDPDNGVQYTNTEGEGVFNWNVNSDVTLYPRWIDAFKYDEMADGSGYIVSKGDGIIYLKTVTIPAEHEGKKVVMVEGSCFKNCTLLETVNIPNTVQLIVTGDQGSNGAGSAFEGCSSLKQVNIYEAEGYTGEVVYESDDKGVLYKIEGTEKKLAYFPQGKTGIYSIPDGVTEIPLNTFTSSKITTLSIPASVTNIGDYAFKGCKTLLNIEFRSDGSTETLTFGKSVFADCTGLTSITLPARVNMDLTYEVNDVKQNFFVNTFSGCKNLKKLDIEGENKTYTSNDGVIFKDNGTTIFYCPKGRTGSYQIPVGVATIGESSFSDCTLLTGLVIPEYVMTIEKEAFSGCTKIASIRFIGSASDSPLTIQSKAFYRCYALTEITLPANLYELGENAFGSTTNLTKVTVNAGLAEVKYASGAFSSIDSDKGVTYTEKVQEVYLGKNVPLFDVGGVFGSGVKSVTVATGNPNYSSEDGVLYDSKKEQILYYPDSKEGAVVLPSTIKVIGGNVFYKKLITSVTIGKNVESIGDGAFKYCLQLTEVIFEGGREKALTIGDNAFEQCWRLTSIEIPETVTSIGHFAFKGCTLLASVSLPSTLESLAVYGNDQLYTKNSTLYYDSSYTYAVKEAGIDVFDSCTSLKELTVAKGEMYTSIDNVLCGLEEGKVTTVYFSPAANGGADGVVTLPNTVRVVKDKAFFQCKYLTEIVFSDSEEEVELAFGNHAFADCKGLNKVVLPKGLTEIAVSMFEVTFDAAYGSSRTASSLHEIVIPNTVTLIHYAAFRNCVDLEKVTFVEGGTAPLVIEDAKAADYTDGNTERYSRYYGAFSGCISLKTIAFPERTTQIGSYAFYKLTSNSNYADMTLEEVTIPSTVKEIHEYAFALIGSSTNVSALKKVTFSGTSQLQTIGKYAFQSAAITEITIPASLTTISTNAFYNDSKLEKVTFESGSGLETIESLAFQNCYALKEINLQDCTKLTSIGDTAFQKNYALTAVVLPASLNTIGKNVFDSCTSLASVTFATYQDGDNKGKSDLKVINADAFRNTALTRLDFPVSTSEQITLGNYLFEACKKFTTVYLSASIKSVGSAFARCPSLTTIEIAEDNDTLQVDKTQPLLVTINTQGESIGIEKAFVAVPTTEGSYTIPAGIVSISSDAFLGQNGIKKLTIPSSVQVIGDNAFKYCRGLETIVFEDGSQLRSIGSYSFAHCYNLQSVSLPEGLQKIGKYAFYACSNLTTAKLPSTLTGLGKNSFEYCTSLTSINVPAIVYSSTDDYTAYSAFGSCTSLTNITFSSTLTWLGQYMFQDCTSLETVTIPESVVSVEAYVFEDCTGLKTVNINGNITTYNGSGRMFDGCTALTTVNTTDKFTWVGTGMFYDCTALTSLDFRYVTHIDKNAFTNSGLQSLIVSTGITSIGNSAFYGATAFTTLKYYNPTASESQRIVGEDNQVTIPDTVSNVGNATFQNSGVKYVILPLAETILGDSSHKCTSYSAVSSLFYGCTELTTVVLHDGITAIGAQAFAVTPKLTTIYYRERSNPTELIGNENEVTLPEGITILGSSAFGSLRTTKSYDPDTYTGSGIVKVTIPNSVVIMGNYVFEDCYDLKEVTFGTGILSTGYNSKEGTASTQTSARMFSGCTSLEKVVLHDKMTILNGYTFENCYNLKTIQYLNTSTNKIVGAENEVTLPTSLVKLNSTEFKNCSSLEKVNMASVTTLGTYDFQNCTSLKEVTLKSTLTSLPNYFFDGCTNLTTVKSATSATATASGTDKVVTLPAVTSLGTYVFQNCKSLTSFAAAKLTTIGTYAFNGCTSLTKADISLVTSLGNYAFNGCSSLSEVKFKTTLTAIGSCAFQNCSSLTSVTLPTSLTTINSGAFFNAGLTSVTIPAKVATIGSQAFEGCPLTSLTVNSSNTNFTVSNGVLVKKDGSLLYAIGSVEGEYTLPEGTKLSSYALKRNTSITKIYLTADQLVSYGLSGYTGAVEVTGGTSIPTYAFYGYLGNDITLPEGITSIANSAFTNCSNLQQITLPQSLETIGNYVFSGCESLKSITIPKNVVSVGTYLFGFNSSTYSNSACTSLESVSILGSLANNAVATTNNMFKGCTALKNVTFGENTPLLAAMFNGCTALETITLNENVTRIYPSTFMGCTALKSINLENITAIGSSAFSGCTSLANIVLSNELTSIDSSAFNNCTSLNNVVLPASVTTIGNSAFAGCTALSNFEFSSGLTSLGTSVFAGAGVIKITIPTSITAIPDKTFQNCASLTTVILHSEVESIGANAFENAGIQTITLPEGITSIGKSCFTGSALQSIVLPGTLVKYTTLGADSAAIGSNAFANCLSLKSVVLEEGIRYLASQTFSGCTALEELVLPKSLAYIENNTCFANCTSIKKLVISANTVKVGMRSFSGWTADQTIVIEVYLYDLDCAWAQTWDSECNAKIEYVYISAYDD